jgi:hypothetical protein
MFEVVRVAARSSPNSFAVIIKHMKHLFIVAFVLVVAHTEIARGGEQAPVTAPHAGAATAISDSTPFSGKVLETTNAAGYTYILVDTGTNKLWAAAPQFQVKPGDRVEADASMPMPKYHSKTLNRDFDVVYFTGAVAVNGIRAAGAGAAGNLPKDHPPVLGITKASQFDLSGLKKAEGGETVAEIYRQKDKLTGKEVKVRGKVVKYNSGIMGKNWLHVQDGSGATGSNDLTVTTSTNAKVGDTVLITGKLSANQDFGSGYKYALIVQDAKVLVENP